MRVQETVIAGIAADWALRHYKLTRDKLFTEPLIPLHDTGTNVSPDIVLAADIGPVVIEAKSYMNWQLYEQATRWTRMAAHVIATCSEPVAYTSSQAEIRSSLRASGVGLLYVWKQESPIKPILVLEPAKQAAGDSSIIDYCCAAHQEIEPGSKSAGRRAGDQYDPVRAVLDRIGPMNGKELRLELRELNWPDRNWRTFFNLARKGEVPGVDVDMQVSPMVLSRRTR